jgi:hypothetical protein
MVFENRGFVKQLFGSRTRFSSGPARRRNETNMASPKLGLAAAAWPHRPEELDEAVAALPAE